MTTITFTLLLIFGNWQPIVVTGFVTKTECIVASRNIIKDLDLNRIGIIGRISCIPMKQDMKIILGSGKGN